MSNRGKKAQAETILQEVPSILAAYVREDIAGNPREIHLLASPGPDVRQLARDVRSLLEARLQIEIDQRIISIAQLSEHVTDWSLPADPAQVVETESDDRDDEGHDGSLEDVVAGAVGLSRMGLAAEPHADPRLVYSGLEVHFGSGRTQLRVSLDANGDTFVGEARDVDTRGGRIRAAAAATLAAAAAGCKGAMEFHLEGASVVRVFDRDMVLVSVAAVSTLLGRKPLALVGAQPIDGDAEEAAAFAALKAIGRVVVLGLKHARR